MKYKVILDNIGSSVDNNGVGFSFYTKASAINCAQTWVETSNNWAYLWDGVSWTKYQ